jgi:acyl dehydratase
MTARYLEDSVPGRSSPPGTEGRWRANHILRAEFDPQPFHLNEEAARGSVFKDLAASGWHTAAMTMRLLMESELKREL